MKIRESFVSNSSSTSFCIIGLSGDDANKKLGEDWMNTFEDDANKKLGEDWMNTFENEENEDDCGLTLRAQEDCGYIGLDIEKMAEDETLGAFKERAARKLSEFFKKEINKEDVSILVDGWHD